MSYFFRIMRIACSSQSAPFPNSALSEFQFVCNIYITPAVYAISTLLLPIKPFQPISPYFPHPVQDNMKRQSGFYPPLKEGLLSARSTPSSDCTYPPYRQTDRLTSAGRS